MTQQTLPLLIKEKPKKQKMPNDLQKIILAYKIFIGIDINDKKWDKKYFKRFSAPAKDLKYLFDDDVNQAISCIEFVGKNMQEKKLEWNLSTVVKRAYDYKKYLEQEEKNGK